MGLAIDATDATLAANAIGICRKQSGESWGLVSAAWVFPDGTSASATLPGCPAMGPPNPLSHGLLTSFGTNGKPRDGSTMLAISSGAARAGETDIPAPGSGTSPQAGIMCTASAFPSGFPVLSPSCAPVISMPNHPVAYDGMALELHVKVPTNASGLSFDFNFFSTEFPEEICSMYGYNDQFVALLWSKATSTPANHNVSFDSMGEPVDVDSALVEVCTPTTYDGVDYTCPLGPSQLDGTAVQQAMGNGDGTSYESGGATGWLTSSASVVPGETIILRFAIWDAGDNILDSTTLLDHLTWSLASGDAAPPPSAPPATVRPPR